MFIKLDVEGSELAFLRGAIESIQTYRPTMILEINPDSAKAAGHSVADIISTLRLLGYSRFAEMEDYPNWQSFDDLTSDRLNRFRDLIIMP